MAHMSNMFSHRVATKCWSIWYIKWENMGRKGNMGFFHYNVVNQHRGWLSLHGSYSRPANQ